MSGGPVFNEDGEVVGLVSTSYEYNDGYSFWFEPLHNIDKWLRTVDPLNPGWFKGWAVRRTAPWHLAAVCLEREEAEKIRQELGEQYQVVFGANRYGSDDFIGLSM
jgi:serine protease Do